MENDKNYRVAKRLGNLSILLGVMGVVSGGLLLVAFSASENLYFFLVPVIVYLLIVVVVVFVPGMKVKKYANDISKVKGSLFLLLIAGIYVLISTIPGISLVFANDSRSSMALPLALVPIIISIWVISDSLKLLKVAKTKVSPTNI